jgi:hypothetical protein
VPGSQQVENNAGQFMEREPFRVLRSGWAATCES